MAQALCATSIFLPRSLPPGGATPRRFAASAANSDCTHRKRHSKASMSRNATVKDTLINSGFRLGDAPSTIRKLKSSC
jgi:hypothetical protein